MEAGVRNQFIGEIIDIIEDGVMSQVTVKVGQNQITSVMTRDSLLQAGFKKGDQVTALVKAVNVVLVK